MRDKSIISGVLYTKDKVNIAYENIITGHRAVVIICPGFFNSKKNRWMRKAVELVSSKYDVMIFDFRGHGDSGGKFTWSAKEHLDFEAVLNYAKEQGYLKLAVLAFSLGAAVTVNLLSKRNDVKSMVLISCPYDFWKINYHFWEPGMLSELKENINCKWKGKGARFTDVLLPKPKPINNISKIKHTHVLFIHGDKDWIIKDLHSKKLFDAAHSYKKLEIIKNGLHAERLIQQFPDKMKKLILDWFSATMK